MTEPHEILTVTEQNGTRTIRDREGNQVVLPAVQSTTLNEEIHYMVEGHGPSLAERYRMAHPPAEITLAGTGERFLINREVAERELLREPLRGSNPLETIGNLVERMHGVAKHRFQVEVEPDAIEDLARNRATREATTPRRGG